MPSKTFNANRDTRELIRPVMAAIAHKHPAEAADMLRDAPFSTLQRAEELLTETLGLVREARESREAREGTTAHA
jgi:hypothetical protein